MSKFVTIGYGDPAGYDRTDPSVSKTLCAVAHGVVEVSPLESTL